MFIFCLSFRKKRILRGNVDVKNQYKNQTIYILGNGPSINNVNFDYLKNKKTMVVNYFLQGNSKLKPSFLCVLDRAVNYNYIGNYIDQKDIKFLLDISYHKIFSDKSNVYYSDSSLITDYSTLKDNFASLVSQTSNVIPHAIMWAIYMGFNKIILLGCEFDLACYKSSRHFYDKSIENKTLPINFSYVQFLNAMSRTVRFHYMINNNKTNKNIEIINSSPFTYIDTYKIAYLDYLYK